MVAKKTTGKKPGHNVEIGKKGFQKTTQVKPVAPKAVKKAVAKKSIPSENDGLAKVAKSNENNYTLNLVKAEALPEALLNSFPNGVNKTEMAKVYEKVAKSMLEDESPIFEYEVPEEILPSYDDSKGIRATYRTLGLDDSSQIESLVEDEGENLKDMDETKLAWIKMTYDWAYDALMEYLGGYEYVTTNSGTWGFWQTIGESVEKGWNKYTKKSDWRRERFGF